MVGSDRRFRSAYTLMTEAVRCSIPDDKDDDVRPDDGGSKHVDQFLSDYTAEHPRRQPSSYSLP
jgi:hypothetical protein